MLCKFFVRIALFTGLLVPGFASAGCTYIASVQTRTLYVDISDGGCGEFAISFTRKIKRDGQPDLGSIQTFPFKNECVLQEARGIPTGLSCHAQGHTPLADAVYKRKKAGYRKDICGPPGEKARREPYYEYVCVTGCNMASAPRVLDEDPVCD
jgi:hypothetical protein